MVIKQAAGSRQQAAGSRQQAAGSRQQAALTDFNCTQEGRVHDVDFFFNSDLNSHSNIDVITHSNTDSNADLGTNSTTDLHTDSILDSRCRPDFGFDFDLQLDSLQGTNHVTQSYLNSRKKPLVLAVMLSGLFATTLFTVAHAALSATTANTIQGTAPYLTFDGGVTKATKTDELLGITISDGTTETTYTKNDLTGGGPGTASNPIELPVAGQKLEDIKTLIPLGLTTVNLSALIGSPYNYWGDEDGDGLGVGGISATGSLSISAEDVNGNAIGLTSTFSACNSPYQVTLTSTAGTLSTQYGAPNSTTFSASNVTYYIKPKIVAPYACFAKPNLVMNTGSESEWDGANGFKPQNVAVPSKNFPRTGFDGAFFDITVAGATAANVIAATGPTLTGGGVTATLTEVGVAGTTNVVRVSLTGPKNPSGGIFTPSDFKIKASASGLTNDIYSFALSKWYIAKPGYANGYPATQSFCNGLSGSYRIPSVSEYTNANSPSYGWTGGLPGNGNTYARAIGNGKQSALVVPGDDGVGGLFAEWGITSNTTMAGWAGSGYYPSSDFVFNDYWTVESYSTNQYFVHSYYGYVAYTLPSSNASRAACVMP